MSINCIPLLLQIYSYMFQKVNLYSHKSVESLLLCLLLSLIVMSCGSNDSSLQKQKINADEILKRGQTDFANNHYALAFSKYSKALQMYEALNDTCGLFRTTVFTGMMYFEIGLKAAARECVNRASQLMCEHIDIYCKLHYYRLSAFLKADIDHDYPAAINILNKSLVLQRRFLPRDTVGYYGDLANIAETYMHGGEYDKAIVMLDSIELSMPSRTLPFYSEIYFCRGKVYYLQHKYSMAYEILLQSCNDFIGNYVINNRVEAYGMLASIDSLRHDYHAYFIHHGEYSKLKDKLINSEMTYRMAVMQGRHHMDVMKQEADKAKSAQYIQTLSLIFAVIVCVIFSVVVLLLYKRSETLKKLSIAEKEKVDIEYERERLEKELVELKYKQSDERLNEANRENVAMSLKLATNPSNDKNDVLEPFENAFRQLDSAFVPHLEERFPSLTKYEVRLACFIKVGMSSEEMVAVLNISMSSLNTSRYRLRKKLGLKGGQNLYTFISSIS